MSLRVRRLIEVVEGLGSQIRPPGDLLNWEGVVAPDFQVLVELGNPAVAKIDGHARERGSERSRQRPVRAR